MIPHDLYLFSSYRILSYLEQFRLLNVLEQFHLLGRIARNELFTPHRLAENQQIEQVCRETYPLFSAASINKCCGSTRDSVSQCDVINLRPVFSFCQFRSCPPKEIRVDHEIMRLGYYSYWTGGQYFSRPSFHGPSPFQFVLGTTVKVLRAAVKNIATGETSQAITPFHFFDNFNFPHQITFITR